VHGTGLQQQSGHSIGRRAFADVKALTGLGLGREVGVNAWGDPSGGGEGRALLRRDGHAWGLFLAGRCGLAGDLLLCLLQHGEHVCAEQGSRCGGGVHGGRLGGLSDGVVDEFGGDVVGQFGGAQIGAGEGLGIRLVGADLAVAAVAGSRSGGGFGGAGHLSVCGLAWAT